LKIRERRETSSPLKKAINRCEENNPRIKIILGLSLKAIKVPI
jgi:hypothetical protein